MKPNGLPYFYAATNIVFGPSICILGSQTDFDETIEEVGVTGNEEEQMHDDENLDLGVEMENNFHLLETEIESDDPRWTPEEAEKAYNDCGDDQTTDK